MPTPRLALSATALLLLAGCAPAPPTVAQAREAMVARMERPGSRVVKVTAVEAFTLEKCRPAEPKPGMLCDVAMDISFDVDGAPMRSADAQAMRFVREAGDWVAYPE